jgi:hypothetical protein
MKTREQNTGESRKDWFSAKEALLIQFVRMICATKQPDSIDAAHACLGGLLNGAVALMYARRMPGSLSADIVELGRQIGVALGPGMPPKQLRPPAQSMRPAALAPLSKRYSRIDVQTRRAHANA